MLDARLLRNVTNIDYLKSLGCQPRVHGNGFIQFEVADHYRLHYWAHPDIPRQKVATPIHDHLFHFTSWCLSGRLINIVYAIEPGGIEFQVYVAQDRKDEDTALVAVDQWVGVRPVKTEVLVPGFFSDREAVSMRSEYTLGPRVFHETLAPEPTITLMRKTLSAQGEPRVLIPAGAEPDNDFDRYDHDPEHLWRIIEEMTAQQS